MANELFETRAEFKRFLDRYPRCHGVLHRLRDRASTQSVEQVLSELQEEAADNFDREPQLAAIRFYLGDLLWRCKEEWLKTIPSATNYDALVDELVQNFSNEHLCFVTFNYDTMLEDALCNRGLQFGSDIKDYISSSSISVIKLHGSVNWGQIVIEPMMQTPQPKYDDLLGEMKRLKFGDYVIVQDVPLGVRPAWGGYYAFPALALPVVSKRAFACPDDHVLFLENQLLKVDKLLIIGWRAADTNFVDLLKKHLKPGIKTVVVSAHRNDAEAVIETLTKTHELPLECKPFDGGFSDFINKRRISQLLA